MSSAICFNLDRSKILSVGNGLKPRYFTVKGNQEHAVIKESNKIKHINHKMTCAGHLLDPVLWRAKEEVN